MKAVNLTLTSLLAFVLIHSIKATQLVLTPPSSSPTLSPSDLRISPHDASLNAQKRSSEVFNAVNSALRQWGSSLKHNGMSFIPVSIPANTLLYHGTYTTEPVKGTEWLAFEIEVSSSSCLQPRLDCQCVLISDFELLIRYLSLD